MELPKIDKAVLLMKEERNMLEQQKVTVTGHLRLKRGIYQLVTIAKFPDGTKKEKSKSTGLQEKGNKKRS